MLYSFLFSFIAFLSIPILLLF